MSAAFPLDPAVMARIRPMRATDVRAVAALHHADMGHSLWATLGERFLLALYRGLINNGRFLGFVYVDDANTPQGFIAGSTDASTMMGELLRTSGPLLAASALPGVLRHPRTLVRLLQTPLYFSRSDDSDLNVPAESLFCSFAPALRGQRISNHINKVLFDELLARGCPHVKITTEADNLAANRQLQRWGFTERRRFRFYGKDMVTYVLDLSHSPRVEAVSRHPATPPSDPLPSP